LKGEGRKREKGRLGERGKRKEEVPLSAHFFFHRVGRWKGRGGGEGEKRSWEEKGKGERKGEGVIGVNFSSLF